MLQLPTFNLTNIAMVYNQFLMASQSLQPVVWQFLSLIAQERHLEGVDHQRESISYNTEITWFIPAFQLSVRDKNLSAYSYYCGTSNITTTTITLRYGRHHYSGAELLKFGEEQRLKNIRNDTLIQSVIDWYQLLAETIKPVL